VAKPPKESILGQGNYGCVWRAKDPKTGEVYAVKNMREADATREVQLFHHLHEKAAHPCIVRLYHCQVFSATKLCTMIMEFCAGGDLQIACQSERKASIAEGRPYFAPLYTDIWLGQVLLALEHLHLETQCLIRDLKPANVLLDAGGQCAKLADFGLGRVGVESAGKWTLGGPTGTPGYVSPEILMKERYDFRADLYSYGVMIWVMATGGITQYQAPQPPSNARRMRGGDFHVLNEDWRLLHDTASKADGGGVAPPVEGHQRDLILSLTARNPLERPDHAGVRSHPFFAELDLPDKGAPEDAVRAWSSHHIERIQEATD
jgi:serine/threonine protein kinase